MIFGIGVDVLEAARVKKLYDRYGEHFVAFSRCASPRRRPS
jgi:phosphopantetheinyl transferase (holo-ACP synthase)